MHVSPRFADAVWPMGTSWPRAALESADFVDRGRTRPRIVTSRRLATGVALQHTCGVIARLVKGHTPLQLEGERGMEGGENERERMKVMTQVKGRHRKRTGGRRLREERGEEQRRSEQKERRGRRWKEVEERRRRRLGRWRERRWRREQ